MKHTDKYPLYVCTFTLQILLENSVSLDAFFTFPLKWVYSDRSSNLYLTVITRYLLIYFYKLLQIRMLFACFIFQEWMCEFYELLYRILNFRECYFHKAMWNRAGVFHACFSDYLIDVFNLFHINLLWIENESRILWKENKSRIYKMYDRIYDYSEEKNTPNSPEISIHLGIYWKHICREIFLVFLATDWLKDLRIVWDIIITVTWS